MPLPIVARRVLVTGAVVGITITGTLYGAGLKMDQEVKEVGFHVLRVETTLYLIRNGFRNTENAKWQPSTRRYKLLNLGGRDLSGISRELRSRLTIWRQRERRRLGNWLRNNRNSGRRGRRGGSDERWIRSII